MNIILVIADTLRRDHLPCYGNSDVNIPERVQAKSLPPMNNNLDVIPHNIVLTGTPLEELGVMTKTLDDEQRKTLEISPSNITDGEWDLLCATRSEPIEHYHSMLNPHHEHNLTVGNPQIVERLHRQCIPILEDSGSPWNPEEWYNIELY